MIERSARVQFPMDYEHLRRTWNPWSSIPADYNVGADLTAGQAARGLGDKPALRWENAAGAARTLTYRQLDALSDNLARSLTRLGVGRRDRVFLRLPNIPEFYIAALAAAKNGSVFVPTSTQFRAGEVEYRLRDSGACAAVVAANLLDVVEEVAPRCPDLRHIIVAPYPEPIRSCTYEDFGRLCGDAPARSPAWRPAETRHDDPAFIGYTSGTTGDPRGVVHLQRYPRAYEGQGRYWHDYRDNDVVACPSELGWLLPLATTFLYALCRGLTVVLYDAMGQPFSARTWFDLFQRHRIANFTATPTVYRHMLAAAAVAPEFDLSHWRHGVSCGEPLGAETYAGIEDRFRVSLFDGIGTTECPVCCSNLLGLPVRPGSCGRPGVGISIDLLDEELRPAPATGILCVRRDNHPGIMQGYWNKPERTAAVFRGPWYVTGDVLRRDEDGYYWFQARADDLIKSSGYLISPCEVEQCLCSHPSVLDAAAVARPDPLRGQIVQAFIVPRDRNAVPDDLLSDVRAFVKRKLAPFKCPRRFEVVTDLPRTTTGKIRRCELRARCGVERPAS